MFRVLLVVLALFTFTGWTDEKVRVVVPQAAGNSQDIVARKVTEYLAKRTGKVFFVENKPGASSTIGTRYFLTPRPKDFRSIFQHSIVFIHQHNQGGRLQYSGRPRVNFNRITNTTHIHHTRQPITNWNFRS